MASLPREVRFAKVSLGDNDPKARVRALHQLECSMKDKSPQEKQLALRELKNNIQSDKDEAVRETFNQLCGTCHHST